jgi:beta-aspartyl-peptidase (threonine type)
MSLPSIAVHGGVGVLGDECAPEAAAGVAAAARVGFAVLREGGSALQAVIAAVRALEDDVHFNAGTGSVLTSEGTIENDAAVMWGADLSAGAVAAVSGFKNPILLADQIRKASPHVLLVGPGAERFGEREGLSRVQPASMITERQRSKWQAEVARRAARLSGSRGLDKHGTVGAVAADLQGHVAAATSTGGTFFKWPGRVGDTPIIGGGTYADDRSGAASCTGEGEAILKVTLARSSVDLLRGGASAQAAAEAALAILSERTRADGGLILAAPNGDLGIAFNTLRMSRARCSGDHPEPRASVDR